MDRRFFSCVLGLFLLFLASPAFAEKPLTNEDVIKLSKLGLGDEVVAAKIHQAAEVDFRLETDDLGKLKTAGVSGRIIAAMLDRSSEPSSENAPGPNGGPGAGHVKLVQGDKVVPLASMLGEPSSTYVYVTMLFWDNFPGLHAAARTSDREPQFLIATDQDPRSRYVIVRLDINDKDGDRSLKMGRSGAFSFKASNAPDSDWTFPFDSKEEKRGTWRLSLRKPLPPGEYGVFVVQQGELFDFGVD
jgi:hypothetical protein